ncbi:NAD-dependent epimerase/dehydratase family protein [Aquimarina rhabdastrellae]
MKNILILGGTNFIGRNLIQKLKNLGEYKITLFNRGKTNATINDSFNFIKGDRQTADIEKLANQHWDYIIDLSCYYPDSIRNILKTINTDVVKYILISTCSVYDLSIDQFDGYTEESPVHKCTKEERIDNSIATYGKRKVACEEELRESGISHLILRPALVYGAYDHTDRFYYWLYQVYQEREILVPNQKNSLVSLTYVDDLVAMICNAIDHNIKGTYNVVTEPSSSIASIIEYASDILKKKNRITEVSNHFLHEKKIKEWIDIPLWLDSDKMIFKANKLKNTGIYMPSDFINTIAHTIKYYDAKNWYIPTYGISESLKQKLLKESIS